MLLTVNLEYRIIELVYKSTPTAHTDFDWACNSQYRYPFFPQLCHFWKVFHVGFFYLTKATLLWYNKLSKQ